MVEIMPKCPKCGKDVSEDVNYCPNCGSELRVNIEANICPIAYLCVKREVK
jgi:predicted amidophosphoribosyltransferase